MSFFSRFLKNKQPASAEAAMNRLRLQVNHLADSRSDLTPLAEKIIALIAKEKGLDPKAIKQQIIPPPLADEGYYSLELDLPYDRN